MSRFFLFVCLICLGVHGDAQFYPELNYPVEVDNRLLMNAFAGGAGAPQFSVINFNNDGIEDLFVFDRLGGRVMTFVGREANGTIEYDYAPEYGRNFPKMTEWALLRDLNNDGIQDIFCSSALQGPYGVEVYIGQNDGTYEKVFWPGRSYDILFAETPDNRTVDIYVSNKDLPAIDDIDGDGDLDILTFESQGAALWYYKNITVEEGLPLEDLKFVREDECWGKFYEAENNEEITLSNSPNECAEPFGENPNRLRHAGSTMSVFDQDGDGDMELLLGDLTNEHLFMLVNGGSPTQAWMTDQDNRFPSYDQSVEMPVFITSFILDYNQDGILDLIASVNDAYVSEDIDNQWYYVGFKNGDEQLFSLEQKDILTEHMIDLGIGAKPEFFDINGDGLLDIVVGNEYSFVDFSSDSARIVIFENVGTPTSPAFELADSDFLNMSRFTGGQSGNFTRDFRPEFGDLDGDGDEDFLAGCDNGTLFYAENLAGPGNPPQFGNVQFEYMDIDVGSSSHPEIYDVNGDGLADLIIGGKNGNNDEQQLTCGAVNYFENVGQPGSPMFLSGHFDGNNDPCFGRMTYTKYGSKVYSAPQIVEFNGEPRLYIGTREGISAFDGVTAEKGVVFEMIDSSMGNIYTDISQLSPAFADIDNDGTIEMLVGHQSGGLTFYKTDHHVDGSVSTRPVSSDDDIVLFPNPTNGVVQTNLSSMFEFEVFSVDGRMLMRRISEDGSMDLSHLKSGVYMTRIHLANGVVVVRRILKD